jgi:hypothetical protein
MERKAAMKAVVEKTGNRKSASFKTQARRPKQEQQV